jgi:dihydroorotase
MTGAEIPDIKREPMALPFGDDLIEHNPDTKIVFEHPTTIGLMKLIKQAPANIGCTPATHHQILTYDDVVDKKTGQINPYLYCKPVAKSADDRDFIREEVINGEPHCFFGTDIAPWPIAAKEAILKPGEKPKAGIANFFALIIQLEIFAQSGKIENFRPFVSERGPKFYGLEPSREIITFVRKDFQIPDEYAGVKVFWGGKTAHWHIEET